MRILIAALLLGAATPAFADAAASFRDGKWSAAIAQGRAEASFASLVLAGRAALVQAAYGTTEKAKALELIASAERDFEAALLKSPGNADALFQKSVATGYRAKLTTSPGLGKESRRGFEAYRTARPNDALGWSAIAGWHGGAIATLGGFMAGTVLGAKKAEVESGFSQAIKLEPTNPVHRVFFAQTLLDLDTDNALKAAATLQGVGRLPARDGYEAMVRAQGVQIAAALQAGDVKAAQALSRRLSAFGTLG